jgi:small subunit ribosomal protein S6
VANAAAGLGYTQFNKGVSMAERFKLYECCALYRPDLEPEKLDSEIEAVKSLITTRSGEVARIDRWNKRYLAYPIKDYTEGFYVIFRWYSSPALLPDLAYQLRYSDGCLRHMILDYTEKDRKRRKRLGKAQASKV